MFIYETIINKTLINKGWSGDKKYRIVTKDGDVYLLRLAPPERMEQKRREFEAMQKIAELKIPMCFPVEFGTCSEGVYSIQSWVDGEDVESTLAAMDAGRQYRYGWCGC